MLDFPPWKIALITGICVLGLIFALPNVFDENTRGQFPSWAPTNTVNLGLDLQGGSHFLLEVDSASVLTEQVESLGDTIRQALRDARTPEGRRIGYANFADMDSGISFMLRDSAQSEVVKKVLNAAISPVGASQLGPGQPNFEYGITDTGKVTIVLTEAAISARKTQVVGQSIEVIRRRVDELGTREPTIQGQGEDRIVVQLPGLQDREEAKAIFTQTARLTFHLVDVTVSAEDIARGRVPPGSELRVFEEDENRKIAIRRRAMITGDQLNSANASFSENRWVVNIDFNSAGGRIFADVTRENVGRPFAIVLDEKVISAPNINEPILGGSAQISGSFNAQTSSQLALLLRAGALPADLTVLEERTDGPDMGADSVAAGKLAGVIGMVAVIDFMVLVYGRFGLVADVALFANIVLLFAAMSGLQATLTLPGIAGIVLTVGMAVDANVLVFERIREELRVGRRPVQAVDAGYRNAMSTIFDANITTLLAALLMFQFGSGPVKGFAVTLAIGIITSVFSAIMVTRMILTVWLRRSRPQTLAI
ncbi:MAG: protein translocase subunit SecD [Sphingomonadales bacterium]